MFDKYGYLHDKIPSNNPFIYTGILKQINNYDDYQRQIFYEKNYINYTSLRSFGVFRKIKDKYEPTSLDEIIGAVLLGFMNSENFKETWNWYPKQNTPKIRILQALIYCANKDRNYFKTHKVYDLEDIAYWIPWHVQYWILKRDNKKTGLKFIAFYVWLMSVFIKKNNKTGNISQKNIAWAILKDLGNPLHKIINHKKHLNAYFGKNHIINNLDKTPQV